MRIELDGDWAELRHANKIPHAKTMAYRHTFYRMVEAAGGAEATDEGAASKALIANGGLDISEELANDLVLAVVSAWSYGEVDLDTLMNVPTADLEEIQRRCAGEEYMKVLQPLGDFSPTPDPESPTKPSAP